MLGCTANAWLLSDASGVMVVRVCDVMVSVKHGEAKEGVEKVRHDEMRLW